MVEGVSVVDEGVVVGNQVNGLRGLKSAYSLEEGKEKLWIEVKGVVEKVRRVAVAVVVAAVTASVVRLHF